jgi:hypothetical protein
VVCCYGNRRKSITPVIICNTILLLSSAAGLARKSLLVKKQAFKPGVVAHACNPSYLIGKIMVQGQPRQKAHETSSQPMAGHTDMHLSPQLSRKSTIGGLQCRPSPGNKAKPYLKNNQQEKDWRSGSSSRLPALVSARS